MTLKELYSKIGGDYEQVIRILRVEKLVDKHIRKFVRSEAVDSLRKAGQTMDSTALFEASHALKGVSGNLGLVEICRLASQITEEFRPGHERTMTDKEIREKIDSVQALYAKVAEAVKEYEAQL